MHAMCFRPKRRSAMLLLALVAAASGFQSIRSVQSPRSFQLRSQPKPQKDEIQAELRRLAEEMAQPADDEALAPPPVDLAFAPFFMRALLPLAYRGLAAAALESRGHALVELGALPPHLDAWALLRMCAGHAAVHPRDGRCTPRG